MKLPENIKQFIELAYCRNYWCWFHGLGGALGGWVGNKIGLDLWLIMIIVIMVALIVEIVEWFIEGTKPYGSLKHTIYDSIGDVSFALILCFIGAT